VPEVLLPARELSESCKELESAVWGLAAERAVGDDGLDAFASAYMCVGAAGATGTAASDTVAVIGKTFAAGFAIPGLPADGSPTACDVVLRSGPTPEVATDRGAVACMMGVSVTSSLLGGAPGETDAATDWCAESAAVSSPASAPECLCEDADTERLAIPNFLAIWRTCW